MSEPLLQIRPGVAALLRRDDGRLLLHRRRVGAGWAPPSGGVEAGEDLLAALRREIREETALEIADPALVAVYSDPAFQVVRYPDGRAVHFVTSLFACRAVGGTLAGSEEGLEWAWFAPGELPRELTPYARIWLEDAANSTGAVLVR